MSLFHPLKPQDFTAPARAVERVFIHCSASDDHSLSGHGLVVAVAGWHLARGFSGIGYHFVIDKDGQLWRGRQLEQIPAAQAGHNTGTIAIMVHGLADFTPSSLATLKALCQAIHHAYDGKISFHGHREVAAKECPVFDYRQLLELDDNGKMRHGLQA